jgi:adenosylhomocysteinase
MLPVTENYIKSFVNDDPDVEAVKLFFIQHLLDDTAHYLRLLTKYGIPVIKVVGIKYSSREDVVDDIKGNEIDATLPDFGSLEAVVDENLDSVIHEIREEGTGSFIIQEVGGYCARLIKERPGIFSRECKGIVEDTKQGLWRYSSVLDYLTVPVLQIADSELKDVEAAFVGEAVARVLEDDLLNSGIALTGRRVGILGFGKIGSSVSASLYRRGGIVSVYDKNPTKVINALTRGYAVPRKETLLSKSEIIIGTTGSTSISSAELERLKDNVLLGSASSRDIEFPVGDIASLAERIIAPSPHITEFEMPWNKKIRIVDSGFPLNFRRQSLPAYISDLMFSQLTMCIFKLIRNDIKPGIHRLSALDEELIAKSWLDQYYEFV